MARKKSLASLFNRIIRRKAKNEEKQQFNNWYEQLDISEGRGFKSEGDEKDIRDRILQQVHAQMGDLDDAKPGRYPSMWWRAAAAVALFASLSGVLYTFQYRSQPTIAAYTSIRADSTLKQVKLTDGSVITLNIGSQLRWKADFGKTDRRVELSGEALFQVKHDLKRPFIVLTDSIETYDVGTTFNIESYPNEAEIKVSLLEGAVSINRPSLQEPPIFIRPGEMLAYNRNASHMKVKPIAAENIAGWTTGRLVFNDVPLPEALERLAMHYRLKIVYPQKDLSGMTVTGSFRSEKWQDALKAILFTFNRNYSIRKEVIYIH